MLQIITGLLIAFAAVIIIISLWNAAGEYFFMPAGTIRPSGNIVAFIVTSRGHDEQIEYMVRSFACRAKNLSQSGSMIVVIDQGMDEETRKICEILAKDLQCVKICETKELPQILSGDFQIQ